MKEIITRIKNHFKWSKWESIWKQNDDYKKADYEVFESVNWNWLSRYTKILIVSASCHNRDTVIKKLN